MKKNQWVFNIMLALALLGLPAMTASAAPNLAPGDASVTLTPFSANPVQVGNLFSFELVLSATEVTPGVGGAEIYLGYNPALVAPSATPGVPPAVVMPDFFGVSNVSINEVLPASQCPGGVSPCIHLVLAGPPQTTQTGIAARFNFSGNAAGLACFSILQSKLVNADGFDVAHTVSPEQCVSIESGYIKGTVLRQGTPNTGSGSLACSKVDLTGAAHPLVSMFTSTTGAFKFNEPPVDVYTIRASYPGYLASRKTGVSVANLSDKIDVGTTTLRGGDVNGDNVINILDVGSIIGKFGNTGLAVRSAGADCAGADEAADINDDGTVNISDLAIAASNWGKVGPTAWE